MGNYCSDQVRNLLLGSLFECVRNNIVKKVVVVHCGEAQ